MRADDRAVDQPAQVALLEVVGAEALDRDRHADHLRRKGEEQAGVAAAVAEVLEHVGHRQRVVALPAPFRVERQADDAGLADQLPLLAREDAVGVVLDVARAEPLEVRVEGLPQRLLLVSPASSIVSSADG